MGKYKFAETEKGVAGEEQSQEHCSSFYLTSSGLFTNNLSWQLKHSIPHNIVTFYGDCVKM
jgi:hypothetical protein